ncbi:MAG: MipA/OmpV family protein [Kangiellaceae bacterium]
MLCILFISTLWIKPLPLNAKNSCEAKEALKSEDCTQVGEWNFALGVGIGVRTNPLNNSNNIPLILLPQVSYYGNNFFIENLDFGYNLYDSDVSQLNLLATPSYDSVFFNRWDPSNIFVDIGAQTQTAGLNTQEDNFTEIDPQEVSDREFSYLGGVEYSYLWQKSQIQFSLLSDISNTHSGSEARFAYQYKANDYFSTTFGLTWKDETLTDYYYGVDENEVIDNRGSYDASSSISPFIRFALKTSHHKDAWRMSLEIQQLDSGINQSPLLKDDRIITFFIGKYFHWND